MSDASCKLKRQFRLPRPMFALGESETLGDKYMKPWGESEREKKSERKI